MNEARKEKPDVVMADETEQAKMSQESGGEVEKKEKKRAKEDYPALIRPIIFVCNDGYSKPLFPLKDICLRLKVVSCSVNRIQERLDEILKKEGYRTGVVNYKLDKTIAGIIHQCNGDMTNTLNTVQFLANTGQLAKEDPVALKSQSKDRSDNLFNIAEYIMFDKPDRN
jgi:DNA polymerase III delta prime subunit